MPRDAVWKLLRDDDQLQELGGTGFTVVVNYSYDQIPNRNGPFLVICFRTTDFEPGIQANGPNHFDVYAHIPKARPGGSTDFTVIDALLDRCDDIFRDVEESDAAVIGDDGWQLDYVGFQGRSMDMEDEGYESICRYASYYALGCKAIA